jgi:uncharacterized membrane-anchored protein YhcB (DUF1043 family)
MVRLTHKIMINQILKDPWNYIVTIGTLMVQWVMVHASTLVGLIMGVGGIVTVYFGIREKIKKNKLLDMEIKEMQDRYDDRMKK